MNSLYLAYCRAHGKTPEEMAEHDAAEWPGGRMCGYILWMGERKKEFAAAHPEAMLGHAVYDLAAWASFVQNWKPKQ